MCFGVYNIPHNYIFHLVMGYSICSPPPPSQISLHILGGGKHCSAYYCIIVEYSSIILHILLSVLGIFLSYSDYRCSSSLGGGGGGGGIRYSYILIYRIAQCTRNLVRIPRPSMLRFYLTAVEKIPQLRNKI